MAFEDTPYSVPYDRLTARTTHRHGGNMSTKKKAPERTDLVTDVPADERRQVLGQLFPEAFQDGVFDSEALAGALGDPSTEASERYGLSWAGRAEAQRAVQRQSVATLHPSPGQSVDFDSSNHVIIEGDNLEVLRLLQRGYNDQVKMIYIDPPYNTGGDFIYPDNFREGLAAYLEFTKQVDEGGHRLSSNTDSSGRYHSAWLSMMYPRLVLARNLLRQDGFIFVSIDDHEMHNLRLVLNEVFGEENFVATMVWQGGRKNDARLVSSGHDYILIYARNLGLLKDEDTRWEEKKVGVAEVYAAVARIREEVGTDYDEGHQRMLQWYRELPDGHASKAHDHFSYLDDRGAYFPDNLRSPNPRPNLVYDYKGYQPHPNGWAYARERMEELDADGRICFPASMDQRLKIKSYLHEHETWAPGSVFYRDRRAARKVVEDLLDISAKGLFDYPKDHGVLGRLIATVTDGDDLILDFFAGSGSTGHAVIAENRKDGASRRFLLVQLPEPVNEEVASGRNAKKLGLDTIADICRQRVAAATASEFPDGDGPGFRYYRLGESNFELWDADDAPTDQDQLAAALLAVENNLRGSATDESIAAEILLKEGVRLDVPVERHEVAGAAIVVGDGRVAVFLGRTVTQEHVDFLIKLGVPRVVMLESAFNGGSDEMKSNAFFSLSDANVVMKTA